MAVTHKEIGEIHTIGRRSRQWLLPAEICRPMSTNGILYAGWTNAAWGYRFQRNNPPFAGLIVCESGQGQVWQNNRWQDCGPGHAYLLPRGTPHAYFANRRGIWRICWVAFDPSAGIPLVEGDARMIQTDPRPLRAAIEGLQREVTGPSELPAIQRWVELIRLYSLRLLSPIREDAWLGPLWEQVDANLSHPWTLQELANQAGISAEHLRRLCHAHLHCTPMRHVTQLRMRRAATLLALTNQKVAAIASTVGYNDPFAFSSSFTRQFGVSPAAYRSKRLTPST